MRLVTALALGCGVLAVAGSASARPTADAALTISIAGRGTVATDQGTCTSGGASAACTQSFPVGTAVTLTAVPAPGNVFGSWGGACSGTGARCTVTMTLARSVTATFATAPPPPALELASLRAPDVRALSVGYLVTIHFSTNRAGTGRLRLLAGGRRVGTITFSARAGRDRFGPFLVKDAGRYTFALAFTDLSGRTKALQWRTCLGSCAAAPPPPPPPPPPPSAQPPPPPPPPATTSGALQVRRGEATLVRRAGGGSVTLHFTANEAVTVVVSVLRNSKLVLKGLRFTFPAGAAKIGPFAINKTGSYSFRVVANDTAGRNVALRWDLKV